MSWIDVVSLTLLYGKLKDRVINPKNSFAIPVLPFFTTGQAPKLHLTFLAIVQIRGEGVAL